MTKTELYQNLLKSKDSKGSLLPPPAVRHLELDFLEYKEGEYIKHKAAVKPDYNNPAGVMFGGYYGMFFDAAYGPFSFIETQKYAASLDMNVVYLKAVTPKDEFVITQANIISVSKSFLIMDGQMRKLDGTLVATSTTRMMILDKKIG